MKDTTISMKYTMPKRVIIEQADNGYIVRCTEDDGEKQEIAKDMEEVNEVIMKMMPKMSMMKDESKKENFKEVQEKTTKMMMKKK